MAERSAPRASPRLLESKRPNLACRRVDIPTLLAMRKHDSAAAGVQRGPEMPAEPRTDWRVDGLEDWAAAEHNRGHGNVHRRSA